MSPLQQTHAWAGVLPLLVSTPRKAIRARLDAFVPDAGVAQQRAWDEELSVLQDEGAKVIELHPKARDHAAVLEYTLPREAGRRPDLVVLQNGLALADLDPGLEPASHARELVANLEALRDALALADWGGDIDVDDLCRVHTRLTAGTRDAHPGCVVRSVRLEHPAPKVDSDEDHRYFLDPGLVEPTLPDKPTSSKQQDRLTAAGQAWKAAGGNGS